MVPLGFVCARLQIYSEYATQRFRFAKALVCHRQTASAQTSPNLALSLCESVGLPKADCWKTLENSPKAG